MNSQNNQPMEEGLIEEAVHVEIEIEDRVELLALPLTSEVALGRGENRKLSTRKADGLTILGHGDLVFAQ